MGTMAAPVCYSFLWLTIFGGAGLKMEREAAGANLCCHNLLLERLPEVNLTMVGGNLGEILCEGASCNSCSNRCFSQTSSIGSFQAACRCAHW